MIYYILLVFQLNYGIKNNKIEKQGNDNQKEEIKKEIIEDKENKTSNKDKSLKRNS